MTEKKTQESEAKRPDSQELSRSCGIVMPIASMGEDYPEEHWRRVRKILQKAIERAGMRAQLVWENSEVDVIQTAILQNLYENDVIICDVSGLNPNVMLEVGLRLSTKKPTIIVTDRKVKPPFDISTIGYIEYSYDLEYNAIEDFIEKLQAKIESVSKAYGAGSYKSFVEQFTFETVIPSTVNVSAEEFIKEQIGLLASSIRRIEENQKSSASKIAPSPKPQESNNQINQRYTFTIRAELSPSKAVELESQLDGLIGFGVSDVTSGNDDSWTFKISTSSRSRYTSESGHEKIVELLDRLNIHQYSVEVRPFRAPFA